MCLQKWQIKVIVIVLLHLTALRKDTCQRNKQRWQDSSKIKANYRETKREMGISNIGEKEYGQSSGFTLGISFYWAYTDSYCHQREMTGWKTQRRYTFKCNQRIYVIFLLPLPFDILFQVEAMLVQISVGPLATVFLFLYIGRNWHQ